MPKTAKRSTTRSTPNAKSRKRFSRVQLNERLRELYEHIVAEWEVRKAFDVMIESQLRSLHDISQHTMNLCEREAAAHD